jgi:hypothetical protein
MLPPRKEIISSRRTSKRKRKRKWERRRKRACDARFRLSFLRGSLRLGCIDR